MGSTMESIVPRDISGEKYLAYRNPELALCISLLLLATLAVILRFVARAKRHVSIDLDDWLIVLALVFYAAATGTSIWNALSGGYGYDIAPLPLPLLELTLNV